MRRRGVLLLLLLPLLLLLLLLLLPPPRLHAARARPAGLLQLSARGEGGVGEGKGDAGTRAGEGAGAGAGAEVLLREERLLRTLRHYARAEGREGGQGGKDGAGRTASVVFGFGVCRDVIVSGVALLEGLGEAAEDVHWLRETFALFFREGAAAERYVQSERLWRALMQRARIMAANSTAFAAATGDDSPPLPLGGNAALMANRFAAEMEAAGADAEVVLAAVGGGSGGDEGGRSLQELLHPSVRIVPPPDSDDSSSEAGDVHVILEFQAGERWQGLVAPRANRLALHRDIANAEVASLEYLEHDSVLGSSSRAAVDMFVVGGLQLMQNYPFNEEQDSETGAEAHGSDKSRHPSAERLAKIEHFVLHGLPRDTPMHFELASVSDLGFLSQLYDKIIRHADSLGCNEQELGALRTFLAENRIEYVQDANPRVADTLDQMRAVRALMHARGDYRLTRIHVHTLAYQAIMVDQSASYSADESTPDRPTSRLGNLVFDTAASAARASLTATRWVCNASSSPIEVEQLETAGGGNFSGIHVAAATRVLLDGSFSISKAAGAPRVYLHGDAASESGGGTGTSNSEHDQLACWHDEESHTHICVAPNRVCLRPRQTIGAGDNISGAALVPLRRVPETAG